MLNIVVIDGATANPGDLSWEPIARLGELTVHDYTPKDKVVEIAADADVIVDNKVPITAETLDKLPRLKLIALLATGYNIIDVNAAKQRGVLVCNVPSYSTALVAQHTFALLLELTNHVALHSHSVHAGEWDFSRGFSFWKRPLAELDGKTLGIVGFGSIGRRVAAIASAFGMRVIACSRRPFESEIAECVDLDTLLAQSDVISLHCPLTDATRGLINAETIGKMKPTTFIVNTSRGPVINQADLAAALQAGRIAGAGLDVLETEPPAPDDPILRAPNCIITPHTAWAARETRARLLERVGENIAAFAAGRAQNVVNP